MPGSGNTCEPVRAGSSRGGSTSSALNNYINGGSSSSSSLAGQGPGVAASGSPQMNGHVRRTGGAPGSQEARASGLSRDTSRPGLALGAEQLPAVTGERLIQCTILVYRSTKHGYM